MSSSNWKGFPCGSTGKEPTCNAGDLGLIPGLGRSPGEGKGYTLQYSGLENSMDYIVRGVTKSWTRLSEWTELNWAELKHCAGLPGGSVAWWLMICLPMQETQVQSLCQEDPLEKETQPN